MSMTVLPTKSYTGSIARINVMRERFEQGIDLHHPDDEEMAEPMEPKRGRTYTLLRPGLFLRKVFGKQDFFISITLPNDERLVKTFPITQRQEAIDFLEEKIYEIMGNTDIKGDESIKGELFGEEI